MTFANKYPPLRPSLLLDFAGSKTVDPRITFSRASAATYFDNKGVLRTAPAGVPRIDYDPVTGECRGLLVEEQRTNLLRYSEQFDSAAWVKQGATATQNATIAPDGTLTADMCANNGETGYHNIEQGLAGVIGTQYSISVYAKQGTHTRIRLVGRASSNWAVFPSGIFDLSTGSIVSSSGDKPATIENVGNGWYRCIIYGTCALATSIGHSFSPVPTGQISNNYDGTAYPGYIYTWGAQLEVGSFPTSYTPTSDSQVTRAADAASMTGTNFSDWANSVGTILAKYKTAGWKHNNTPPVTQLDLTKSVDNYSTSRAGDSIERLMFYPRQLTADQIVALKV